MWLTGAVPDRLIETVNRTTWAVAAGEPSTAATAMVDVLDAEAAAWARRDATVGTGR